MRGKELLLQPMVILTARGANCSGLTREKSNLTLWPSVTSAFFVQLFKFRSACELTPDQSA